MLASLVGIVFTTYLSQELKTLQIFRKEHFFRGSDNVDQLLRILKVLGAEELTNTWKSMISRWRPIRMICFARVYEKFLGLNVG